MEIQHFDIEGLVLVKPRIFRDDRGFFLESYNQRHFAEAGIHCNFVQDNHSRSIKNTLRGVHFQIDQPQDKLVRCTHGTVFDVAVDLRAGSPTYGQWQGVFLSAENHASFFIPKGFGHGFSVLSDIAEFQYKCSDFYAPGDEGGLMWNDPDLAIDWQLAGPPLLSPKDQRYGPFSEFRPLNPAGGQK